MKKGREKRKKVKHFFFFRKMVLLLALIAMAMGGPLISVRMPLAQRWLLPSGNTHPASCCGASLVDARYSVQSSNSWSLSIANASCAVSPFVFYFRMTNVRNFSFLFFFFLSP